jgi:periplasmic protein TonB
MADAGIICSCSQELCVGLADHSSRLIAGASIAVMHAAALYGLVNLTPHIGSSASEPAIAVHFISPAYSPPTWRPPDVAVTPPAVMSAAPQTPLIDLSPTPTSTHAISAPQRNSAAKAEYDPTPQLISAVEYLREPSPRYPPQSRRLREEGVVVLRVVIDEQGHACDITVESSSGYARLDRAALEAVASAAFRPYIENGAPRRAQVLIPIEFSLHRRAA